MEWFLHQLHCAVKGKGNWLNKADSLAVISCFFRPEASLNRLRLGARSFYQTFGSFVSDPVKNRHEQHGRKHNNGKHESNYNHQHLLRDYCLESNGVSHAAELANPVQQRHHKGNSEFHLSGDLATRLSVVCTSRPKRARPQGPDTLFPPL